MKTAGKGSLDNERDKKLGERKHGEELKFLADLRPHDGPMADREDRATHMSDRSISSIFFSLSISSLRDLSVY